MKEPSGCDGLARLSERIAWFEKYKDKIDYFFDDRYQVKPSSPYEIDGNMIDALKQSLQER